MRTSSITTRSVLGVYTRTAQRSSARVMRGYSTSFGVASRLFGSRVRTHVENIYSLVRIADEIVDGAAFEAGLCARQQRELLDALETETNYAMATGYSTNLVVHAFASTARATGFGTELTGPFFAAMRRDLSSAAFTEDGLKKYIYGSAEVVGLMCVQVFLAEQLSSPDERRLLEDGARRLGAAFQKVNFLRDMSTDWARLGRNYFPGVVPGRLTETQKCDLVADIDRDLQAAAAAMAHLPADCRFAVMAAYGLFAALVRKLRRTPASELLRARIRVSNPAKLIVMLRALADVLPRARM